MGGLASTGYRSTFCSPGGSVSTRRRNKTARLKAMLKRKKNKERLRKAGRLTKRRTGGRLVKVVRKA